MPWASWVKVKITVRTSEDDDGEGWLLMVMVMGVLVLKSRCTVKRKFASQAIITMVPLLFHVIQYCYCLVVTARPGNFSLQSRNQ